MPIQITGIHSSIALSTDLVALNSRSCKTKIRISAEQLVGRVYREPRNDSESSAADPKELAFNSCFTVP